MFAAAFPICPAVTLAHNIIQSGTHGYKLLKNYQKPKYYGATDIGWFWYLLVFLTLMSGTRSRQILFSNALEMAASILSAHSSSCLLLSLLVHSRHQHRHHLLHFVPTGTL